MNTAMKLIKNPFIFTLLNLIIYAFYGLLIGLAALPAVVTVVFFARLPASYEFLHFALIALGIGLGLFVFLLAALFVFALAERMLTLGFKPGSYPISSPVFIRWLIYGGVHTLCLSLILPYVCGSIFIKMYFRIIGCKFGRDVFFNAPGLNDAYLMEIGDNVIIGGKTDINCHIFEGNHLILNKVKIGSNVLIGANCYIMPGVNIGDNCDIGAGSVIRKNRVIDSGSVILPVPALPMKQVSTLMRTAKSGSKRPARKEDQ